MTHAAIAKVDTQPSARSQPEIVNLPMIRGCAVISIITVMTGTATTPLITAVQYRALMGSIGLRVMATPSFLLRFEGAGSGFVPGGFTAASRRM
jgi:hypothetical protein